MAGRVERREYPMDARMAMAEDDLDMVEHRLTAMDSTLANAVDNLSHRIDHGVDMLGERLSNFEKALRDAALQILVGVAVSVLGGLILAAIIWAT